MMMFLHIHSQELVLLDNNDMQIIEITDYFKCHRQRLSLLVLWSLTMNLYVGAALLLL